MTRKKTRSSMKWHAIDLHLHTPASSDFAQENVTYLEILQRAEARGVEMIAFTDHNTVAGYRKMMEEVEQLRLLEKINRILPDEKQRLDEYERLLKKIQVLPGFEITATFGFHVLAIFSKEKPIREIEHILLTLNVPPELLDEGSVTVGASSDVLTVYRTIADAGGLVIAAHANSSNGVAMRGFNFGGQTKIAFTQDPNLHALEVTDLDVRGRRSTAAFFNGTKPEYPRRMHCIQGSDSHRLDSDPSRKKVLGVGDRVTEVLLPELNFSDLLDLFQSNDFARTRPRQNQKMENQTEFDFVRVAREEGPNIIQDFHEQMTVRGGYLYSIIADVCALANTNGGTLFVGVSADPNTPATGIKSPTQAINQIEKEISNKISPPLTCTVDQQVTGGVTVLRILVPRGEEPPYAVDDNKIYIREESETNLAVRDEIVSLVVRGQGYSAVPQTQATPRLVSNNPNPLATSQKPQPVVAEDDLAPRTGVEVVSSEDRKGTTYFTLRDLRNGSEVKNVTLKSARRLWHYAITAYAGLPSDPNKVPAEWKGDLGLIKRYNQAKKWRYDLVQRTPQGMRYYFGVTEDGVTGMWAELVGAEE